MTRPQGRAPVIAFFPEASFGAALNCVAIAQALARRGAVPVFICHPGFSGVFADYGFREYHLPEAARNGGRSGGDYWADFIRRHLPHFDLSPLDQLETYVGPTWSAIVDTAIAAEEGLGDLLGQLRPDAVVLDNVIMFPAVARAGCPWIRVTSCAETEWPDPMVPPYLSGLSPADAAGRARFEAAYLAAVGPAHRRYAAFRESRGLAPLPAGQFMEASPSLNLLLAPAPVRYLRARPPDPATTVFLEGCVREDAPFEPPVLPGSPAPLVHVGFGSLGAFDTALIDRMIRVFARIPARFVVSVGSAIGSYRNVPDNVFLGAWLPQPSAVARADLFIHHGGNNSFCEALLNGVPSLVMPYCWDGHDNAARAEMTGTGRRLHRSAWTETELLDVVQGLLADAGMRGRLRAGAAGMRTRPGNEIAATAILGSIGAPAGSERTS